MELRVLLILFATLLLLQSCYYDITFKRYNQVVHISNNRKLNCKDVKVYFLDKKYYLIFRDYNQDRYVDEMVYVNSNTDTVIRRVFRDQKLTKEDEKNFEIIDYIIFNELDSGYRLVTEYKLDSIPTKY